MRSLGFIIQTIRTAYPVVGAIKGKSYESYDEAPWIALIILAALIIVFSIIGMCVICFSYGRYKHSLRVKNAAYIRSLPAGHINDSTTELMYDDAPDYLKEYETQSLAVYVPADEPVQEQGEINMNFNMADEATRTLPQSTYSGEASMRSQSAATVSAVNPIYQR